MSTKGDLVEVCAIYIYLFGIVKSIKQPHTDPDSISEISAVTVEQRVCNLLYSACEVLKGV